MATAIVNFETMAAANVNVTAVDTDPAIAPAAVDATPTPATPTLKSEWGLVALATDCPWCGCENSIDFITSRLEGEDMAMFLRAAVRHHRFLIRGVPQDHPKAALPQWMRQLLDKHAELEYITEEPIEYMQCAHCREDFAIVEDEVEMDQLEDKLDLHRVMWINRRQQRDPCATCPHCYLDTCRDCGMRYDNHRGRSCQDYLKWAIEIGGDWDTFGAKNVEFYLTPEQLAPQVQHAPPHPAGPEVEAAEVVASIALPRDLHDEVLSLARDRLANMELIAQEARPCPFCGQHIFKNEGCNHMTCKWCKCQFCWICDWEGFAGAVDDDGEVIPEKRVVTFIDGDCCERHGVTRTLPVLMA
ncbi:hypothetical protein CAOG_06213 [Capsaspora owczarzaki ATCC 30864]|uniref:hypothetical protein n=1 Tax=Capsaspora owczarzaki (strain ATCC 30864) TaxID=595528 RepID=UPI0003527090|nr:hypothetical protein CAOG_06213 [Capsaspora owczarzaki ATCC 30864]|eukprot:XP_004344962.2 hypothetical protein CAOG_06213 [Capsaspora owczarzaki ATCC 30864]